MPLCVCTAYNDLTFRSWNNHACSHIFNLQIFEVMYCHVLNASLFNPSGSMCCGDLWRSRPPWLRLPRGRWVISSLEVRFADNGISIEGWKVMTEGLIPDNPELLEAPKVRPVHTVYEILSKKIQKGEFLILALAFFNSDSWRFISASVKLLLIIHISLVIVTKNSPIFNSSF